MLLLLGSTGPTAAAGQHVRAGLLMCRCRSCNGAFDVEMLAGLAVDWWSITWICKWSDEKLNSETAPGLPYNRCDLYSNLNIENKSGIKVKQWS